MSKNETQEKTITIMNRNDALDELARVGQGLTAIEELLHSANEQGAINLRNLAVLLWGLNDQHRAALDVLTGEQPAEQTEPMALLVSAIASLARIESLLGGVGEAQPAVTDAWLLAREEVKRLSQRVLAREV